MLICAYMAIRNHQTNQIKLTRLVKQMKPMIELYGADFAQDLSRLMIVMVVAISAEIRGKGANKQQSSSKATQMPSSASAFGGFGYAL